MKASCRRPHRSTRSSVRHGATIVEMALAVPVMFLMLLGLFEIGYGFMVQHLMQDTAREGCRIAVLPRGTNAAVLDVVNRSLQAKGISGTTTSILVNNATGDVSRALPGDDIGIVIKVATSSVSIVPRGFLSGELTASCVRRRE
jgi:Flp pilus assembly protein TadG